MPAVKYSGGGGSSRRGSAYRSMPLWLQWVLPFTVAGTLFAALVVFVNYQTNHVPALARVTNPKAIREQNREHRILVEQQQAPHVVRLKAGLAPGAGIRDAVVAYMAGQIHLGAISGPIERSSCTRVSGAGASASASRQVFHCSVTVSKKILTYPFDGVVQPRSGLITYCLRVTNIWSTNVPVSRRCT